MKTILLTALITLLLNITAQAQPWLTNQLVAHFRFNGNPSDSSGQGNHGMLMGVDKAFLPDRFGYSNSLWLNTTSAPAWNLNGAHMSLPRPGALNLNGDFSISLWLKFTNSTPLPNGTPDGFAHNLISNGDDSSGLNLRFFTDAPGSKDTLQLVWGGPGTAVNAVLSRTRQLWSQFTVVRSGSSLTFYRNGQFLTNGNVFPTVNGATLWIGRHGNGGGNNSFYPLVGGIDDIRLYSRALSVTEVQALHEWESGPRLNLIRAVKPAFTNLTVGTLYQLQLSADMLTWTNHSAPFLATNLSMTFPQYWDVENWQHLFFRLQAQ